MSKQSLRIRSECFTSRSLARPSQKLSPRLTIKLNQISLSRGSPVTFMLLSTPSSWFHSIHSSSTVTLKPLSLKHNRNHAKLAALDKDFKLSATKANLNVKLPGQQVNKLINF